MIHEIIKFISKHTILSLIWIILLIIVITLTIKDLLINIKKIDRAQAIQLINKNSAIVVDLRSYGDFYKGHIIHSINIIPSDIKNNNILELEKYKKTPIIIVSSDGMNTTNPARQLIQYGFKQIFILKEGIIGWSSANLPLTHIKK